MTLHLTRHEADRLTADGRVVLFREGVECCKFYRSGRHEYQSHRREFRPPAEFVKAAQPCETCDPRAWVPRKPDLPCGDCLDGKRRVAVVVPCKCPCHGPCGPNPGCQCYRNDGFVTVATVVVTFGPLMVVSKPSDAEGRPYMVEPILSDTGEWWAFVCPAGVFAEAKLTRLYLPPDIDPASLVGQYALGIKAAS